MGWTLGFVVLRDGEVVGTQGVAAAKYGIAREVSHRCSIRLSGAGADSGHLPAAGSPPSAARRCSVDRCRG